MSLLSRLNNLRLTLSKVALAIVEHYVGDQTIGLYSDQLEGSKVPHPLADDNRFQRLTAS